ncbi:hypothetical protein M0804_015362 [Polistes exclamans]|nr:hypothetical protein M0804_015362 [Polistes exclamans]
MIICPVFGQSVMPVLYLGSGLEEPAPASFTNKKASDFTIICPVFGQSVKPVLYLGSGLEEPAPARLRNDEVYLPLKRLCRLLERIASIEWSQDSGVIRVFAVKYNNNF